MARGFLKHRLFKWVIAPAAVVYAVGYGWLEFNYPTCTFRYEITAEVETPEGLKSGSSVVEVSYANRPHILPDPDRKVLRVRGEATYVDLGAGKNLFVTLTQWKSGHENPRGSRLDFSPEGSSSAWSLPMKVWSLNWILGEQRELCRAVRKKGLNKVYNVPFDLLPTLVTFANLKDEESVRVVQPNNLEAEIGQGYTLKRAAIALTNSEVTQSIDEVLTWLPKTRQRVGSVIEHGPAVPIVKQFSYRAYQAFNEPGDGIR